MPPKAEAVVELVTEVIEEEVTEAAVVLDDAFGDIGGDIVVTEELVVEIAAPIPQEIAETIPGTSLGVALTALRVDNVEAGTVIVAEDVPDFEIGNVSVQTVEGEKLASVSLSEEVVIQGKPELIVADDGALTLAIAEPTLNADVATTEVADAVGEVTSIGVSVSAPINVDSIDTGAAFTAEVVSDASALENLVGFTLLAEEEPLAGITVTTDIETSGPASLTMELNAEVYQAMLDAGQVPAVRRITDDGEVQTFVPSIEVVGGTVFFTFETPGFSSFVLLAVEPSTITATPTAVAAPTPLPEPTAEPTATPVPAVEDTDEDGGPSLLVVLAIVIPISVVIVLVIVPIIIRSRRSTRTG